MNQLHILIRELRYFLILWATQALSTLGSSMTGFALIIWSYQQEGSALTTALLSACSYVPYVLMSIFAGAEHPAVFHHSRRILPWRNSG